MVWKVVSSHYSINVRYFWRNVNTIFFKQFIWKMSTYYCLSSPICFQTFSWIVGCILFDQILFKLHVGNHAILLLSVCPSCSSFNLKYFFAATPIFLDLSWNTLKYGNKKGKKKDKKGLLKKLWLTKFAKVCWNCGERTKFWKWQPFQPFKSLKSLKRQFCGQWLNA